MEIETLKETKKETASDVGNLGKRAGVTDARITNRIQEIRERISEAEEKIEDMNTMYKENTKIKNVLFQNIQEIQETVERMSLRIIVIEKSKESQLKGPASIFKQIIKQSFIILKKEMPLNIQEPYRIPNRWG
jgi:DNA-directed RNA polymerase specialized sigma subunit